MNNSQMTPHFPISEYELVSKRTIEDFNTAVNSRLQRGFIMWGMPFREGAGWWHQCMVKPAVPQQAVNTQEFPEGMFRL